MPRRLRALSESIENSFEHNGEDSEYLEDSSGEESEEEEEVLLQKVPRKQVKLCSREIPD